jgi:hypothetical protein
MLKVLTRHQKPTYLVITLQGKMVSMDVSTSSFLKVPKTVVFHSNQLGIRGTETALYDYAHYNEKILGNISIIVTKKNTQHDIRSVKRFADRFNLFIYDDHEELEKLMSNNAVDVLYCIKSGEDDGVISKRVRTVVHCVYNPNQPHGDKQLAVSEWIAGLRKKELGPIDILPHIIHLPDIKGDLRTELNIPDDATVFGRHGGYDTFNLPFVASAIRSIINVKPNYYFLFMNTPRFVDHPRIKFLDSSIDIEYKVKFINTCDAMIHASSLGETFGIACGEFSVRNKPIITYLHGISRNHIMILGDKGIYYTDLHDLTLIFHEFDKKMMSTCNWDCYSDKFNPNVVMRKFSDVIFEKI